MEAASAEALEDTQPNQDVEDENNGTVHFHLLPILSVQYRYYRYFLFLRSAK